MLRAEKTTQNHDDFKVLLVGCVITLMILTMIPLISRGVDLYLTHRPFVVAQTLELIPVEESNTPGILYDADASVNVDSTWIVSIEVPDETRGPLYLISGRASYSIHNEDQAKIWTWQSWFDDGMGVKSPAVPDEPFMVCVRYVSVAKATLVSDETPKKCSPLYDPDLKKEVIR